MPREPQRTVLLRDSIKERIVERILDGTYGPGERVVESAIAAEFGVSQAPVREALRDLEAMRFVESQPHRGARVRAVTSDELVQIYPVRAALEEVAGREAAPRITEEELGLLGDELAGMRRAAENGDLHALMVHDTRFHEIIVEASGNQVLLDVWRSLRVEARSLVSALKSHSDLHSIAELHRPVLQAVQFRDPDLAGKEMRAHIEFFGASVISHIQRGR
ncbi:MAG: Transcriptional Regulator, GntR family [Blastococcus sp.]|jgi:DNA-binding GntR family transcriptional regulator|nr:Transcriptional Regulator, GntR family [Blastococcus sp.]